MKFIFANILLIILLSAAALKAQAQAPDTVYTGIYITSIHDIDFKEKEYTVTFWLWLKYKNKEFDFLQNLEVPQAKTVTRSFSTIDSSGNRIYMLMKMQCVMKDSWTINNFPFDQQKLRLSIENSQFDSQSLIFVADTSGKQFDPRFTLRGWNIDSLNVSTGIKEYETNFGDESLNTSHTEYSSFKVKVIIERDAMGLFWKMFLGMYVAFLIAYMCFYIHKDSIDSRFGLSVGALFAVIGNKYIIDSALPETATFTLVDTLHGLTLTFILTVMICTSFTLKLVKKNKIAQAKKFDFICAQLLLLVYILLNIWFIYNANQA